MRKLTLTAPSAWASAIVNRDYSGLEKEEIGQLNNFLARQGVSFSDCLDCSDAGFCHRHDAWQEMPLSADCQDYLFRV